MRLSVNPPALPAQTVQTKVDDFCAARTGEIPALLWSNFAPPYTTISTTLFSWVHDAGAKIMHFAPQTQTGRSSLPQRMARRAAGIRTESSEGPEFEQLSMLKVSQHDGKAVFVRASSSPVRSSSCRHSHANRRRQIPGQFWPQRSSPTWASGRAVMEDLCQEKSPWVP